MRDTFGAGKRWKLNGRMLLLMLGVLLFIGILIISNAGLNGFHEYMELPTFFSMALLAILALSFTGRGKDFGNAFRLTFRKRQEGVSRMELEKAITALRFARRLLTLEAGIVTLICAVDMLYHMSGLYTLGPALAIAFLSFLYAMVFALLMTLMLGVLEGMLVTYMEEPEEVETVDDAQTIYFKLRAIGLTDREAEVARLVSCEMTNREIGQMLYISDATVKKHITHILEKTKQEDREKLTEMIRGL